LPTSIPLSAARFLKVAKKESWESNMPPSKKESISQRKKEAERSPEGLFIVV